MENIKIIKAGEIYFCDFGDSIGSVQSGKRPCVIIDNTMACAFSPCIHCVPLTTQDKKDIPLHYEIKGNNIDDSIVLCEQYQLIDKSQLLYYIDKISQEDLITIVELCKKNLPFNYR